MKKILVLCTANSCRSQMAHGYFDHFGKDKIEVFSAGVQADGVNQRAIASMREDGIDISHHTSNHVEDYAGIAFDYVITVCDSALEKCPFVPAKVKNVHQDFPDPALTTGSEDEVMASFARTRDMIKSYVRAFVETNIQ